MPLRQLLFLILLSGLLASCVGQPSLTERSIVLAYMGNLDGELEPCGCTDEGDLGGILR